jgi:D-alanine-D-alanine ligase
MGHLQPLRVAIVHNQDFDPAKRQCDPSFASRADVENAARDVARALTARGHQVTTLGVPEGGAGAALAVVAELERLEPDLVFNLCESLAGDARHEAVLPALLELVGLAYTGSGPQALGLALRKDLTKRILVAAGVPTPQAVRADATDLTFPLIVKPSREDASVGISRFSVVHDRAQLTARVAEVERVHQQPALVERYVEGRELYVSLLGAGPQALPMHEIDFSDMPGDRPRIVSYEAKWDTTSVEWKGTQSVRARPLEESVRQRCEAAARAAFHALELRDYARVDLRLAPDGTPYVIDVNPNCDLSDGAGVSRAASFGGLSYADLIERICVAALERQAKPLNESEYHAGPSAHTASADVVQLERAQHPPAAAGRPVGPPGAAGEGRSLHEGGDLGRARARRRRAR